MRVDELVRAKQCTIVDVRTEREFVSGHAPGSINIPLHELPDRIDELRAMNAPLILCCASGNRSGQASYFLSKQGIDCINGGSWYEIDYIQQQSA